MLWTTPFQSDWHKNNECILMNDQKTQCQLLALIGEEPYLWDPSRFLWQVWVKKDPPVKGALWRFGFWANVCEGYGMTGVLPFVIGSHSPWDMLHMSVFPTLLEPPFATFWNNLVTLWICCKTTGHKKISKYVVVVPNHLWTLLFMVEMLLKSKWIKGLHNR